MRILELRAYIRRRGAHAAAALVVVGLAITAMLALDPPAGSSRLLARGTRSLTGSSLCTSQRGPLSYGWPVKPFDRQHPIRGNFGDPRTTDPTGRFGSDRLGSPGDYSFHNGVDISAPPGTPVYPVVSGIAHLRHAREVIVRTADARVFQYWHVIPVIRDGERVIARRTVLGSVQREFDHVHLSEIDLFRIHNPADPGHLTPYADDTAPVVHEVLIRSPRGDLLEPGHVSGVVHLAAEADDTPPVPVPGPWFDHPVTPALVEWRLVAPDGRIVSHRVVADFRFSEPPNQRFWQVYAAGTYQNFPVFDRRYFFGLRGRYLFNLTPGGLDTTRLRNGLYAVLVDAQDVCGNRGSLRVPISIRN